MTSQGFVNSTPVATVIAPYNVAIGATAAYPFPSSRPDYIASGPDGNLWFNDDAGDINQITPTGTITLFPQPALAAYGSLVTGSDGNIWLGTYNRNTGVRGIAQVNTGGSMNFDMPTGGFIHGLTEGPDGNAWFTGGSRGIGFVTPSGHLKSLSLPAGVSGGSITAGADGNLWFTAGVVAGTPQIGRITPGGAVTLFALPAPSAAQWVTLGPDGNVWFTGGPGNGRPSDFVGRITPTGSVTEYLTPTQPSRPAGITAGADGNLWFNETSIAAHSESQVARVTPSGVITEFVIVATNNFQNPKWNIVAGPDGNVWTSAYYGGSILDIATGASSACTASSTTTNPADVVHGTTETVSTTISNCAMKPRLMKLVSRRSLRPGAVRRPQPASTFPFNLECRRRSHRRLPLPRARARTHRKMF